MKHYQKYRFGQLDGQDVEAYRLENDLGYQLSVMTYGATILEYVTPDKQDQFANIVLGFDNFDAYVGNSPKYGASIGPVAGRIAGASFDLNGETYHLEANNGANCNHSGSTGWDSALFSVESVTDQEITLYTERADGTGGFPGNLKIWVTYALTEAGELEISYRVETDQDTLVNPTNHSYFNLSGNFTQPINDHVFQINHQGLYPIHPILKASLKFLTTEQTNTPMMPLMPKVGTTSNGMTSMVNLRTMPTVSQPWPVKKACNQWPLTMASIMETKMMLPLTKTS